MSANMEKAIAAVLAAGFEGAGATPTEHVKFPVSTGHGLGFRGATLGGRLRFAKGDRRVTVGKRTTCFYRVFANGPAGFVNVPTKDLAAVKREAEAVHTETAEEFAAKARAAYEAALKEMPDA